jgi:outer membrane protein assembly factor BamD (BamD/ComL family)
MRRPDRSAKPLPSAAALFARASDFRRQGHLEQAVASYRLLQRRYPRTREASLSFALTGHLQLECDRPAQALVAFDRYLEINQEVSEEALAGRAEALRRLGRGGEEAAAWQRLLARFPGSIYAKRGRSRLAALDAKP